MQKNDIIKLTITDLGCNGEGIGKAKGFTIFVPYAFLGEKIKAQVVSVKNTFIFAKLLEVLTPADERVRAVCPVFGSCGGCQLQHIKYSYQLRYKSKIVKTAFRKIAKLDVELPICTKSNLTYGYRNKLQLPIGYVDGKNVAGFYETNSHKIVPIKSCALHPEWTENIISCVLTFMNENGLIGYDENTGVGDIRHILVRQVQKKFIITLVVNSQEFAYKTQFSEKFSAEFPTCSLYINYNSKQTNVICGDRWEHIFGEKVFYSDCMSYRYSIHPAAFFQVNDNIRDKIYSKILSLTPKNDSGIIIDAYSGSGILSAFLTKTGSKVYGIEIVKEATEIADEILSINNLENKLFNINGDVVTEIEKLLQDLPLDKKITLIVDPPRKGCDEKFLKFLKDTRINQIIYVSCNPATLARDIGILTNILNEDGNIKPEKTYIPASTEDVQKDKEEDDDNQKENDNTDIIVRDVVKNKEMLADSLFDITYMQAYDMFPQTRHVETLVSLIRK